MKIAVLFEGDIYNPRGEFIAIHNRVKNYCQNKSIEVDAYVFFPRYSFLLKTLLHERNGNAVSQYTIDGITYNCRWYNKSLIDSITHKFFKSSTSIEYHSLLHSCEWSKYDLISAHSLKTARIAQYVKRTYFIPYVVTWHGSSIHTLPFIDKSWYRQTKCVLSDANHNFFVSQELQDIANRISSNKGTISLNGIDLNVFYKYSDERKEQIKNEMHIGDDWVNIAYVGNCYPVKNVQYLPYLFSRIRENVHNCHFFIVGNGPFPELFQDTSLPISFLGSIGNDSMPALYNIFHLVVLPSLKEGLPMTCLESIACGSYFVGTRVGEIENVVGKEYSIKRDDDFDEVFAQKCIDVLTCNPEHKILGDTYTAKKNADNEIKLFESIVK